jgi:hypothetical protein
MELQHGILYYFINNSASIPSTIDFMLREKKHPSDSISVISLNKNEQSFKASSSSAYGVQK